MDYSTVVERHFSAPSNVGPLVAPRIWRGEAGSAEGGAWVIIEVEVNDGRIQRIAFRALGCPDLIAACSRATEILSGAPPRALADLDPGELAEELGIAAAKLGSLLILQDALRNCLADWDTSGPAGPA